MPPKSFLVIRHLSLYSANNFTNSILTSPIINAENKYFSAHREARAVVIIIANAYPEKALKSVSLFCLEQALASQLQLQ